MPSIRVTTMYDLNTGNKFGLIGIKTPTYAQIVQRYPGLLQNYKYLKLKRCNVKIACASMLPADPLQVGVTAGKISPADLMNPILYKAVSNDSWNVLVNRIYSAPTWSAESAVGFDDAFSSINQTLSERVYYSLLAGKEWRKVMPQQGLSVKGLKPLVHSVISAFGQQFKATNVYAEMPADDLVAGVTSAGSPNTVADANTIFRGRAFPMPAIPTVGVSIPSSGGTNVDQVPVIPRTYVMAVIMPPSQLQVMYYRMIVSWEIAFYGLRPVTDYSMSALQSDGLYSRYSRWSIASSKDLEPAEDMDVSSVGVIDTINMNPELVMES